MNTLFAECKWKRMGNRILMQSARIAAQNKFDYSIYHNFWGFFISPIDEWARWRSACANQWNVSTNVKLFSHIENKYLMWYRSVEKTECGQCYWPIYSTQINSISWIFSFTKTEGEKKPTKNERAHEHIFLYLRPIFPLAKFKYIDVIIQALIRNQSHKMRERQREREKNTTEWKWTTSAI